MQKIQYKKNTGLKGIVVVLSLIGLIGIIVSVILFIKTFSFNSKSEKIEVTVETCAPYYETKQNGNEQVSYQVYVNYYYNGENYNHILLLGLSESRVSGETLQARINKTNATDVRYMNNTSIFTILLLLIGLALFIGFGYLFVSLSLNDKEYLEIIKNGRKIEAKVTRIYPDKNAYYAKNQYYKLDCEAVEKTFTSKSFKNGEEIQEGDEVNVYYTSLRKNKYYVDVINIKTKQKIDSDNWTFK